MKMLSRYKDFYKSINEESGIRDINKLISDHTDSTGGKDFEIYLHMDLDGLTSGLCIKKYLENYGLNLVDTHIIQYGNIEYAIKNKREKSMAVLVDYANWKTMFTICSDHHDTQHGQSGGSSYAKPSRSNVETLSGKISTSDIFTNSDIELIRTVDSADFLKYDIRPEDIQNAIFKLDRNLSGERNRFLMGFVVNRLLLVFKNKRITVKSLDAKREHVNKNFIECLVLDSSPSIISIFMNIRHYINTAVSLEWDNKTKSHNAPKKLSTPEEIAENLSKYIKSRIGADGLEYDEKYKIVKQYGIGSVYDTGSYDRYVVFKNNPESDFVCTIFPMGLIQISCNPFREKVLSKINLGSITKEILEKYKYQFSNINIPISDIKKINEDEIAKMSTKYGPDYNAVGFTFDDLKAFYPKDIIYLPNREKGDMKTKSFIDLNENTTLVKTIKECMGKKFSNWSYKEKEEMSWLRIPALSILQANSGGHASITNIQGFVYQSVRKDLLKRLFNTEDYTVVMRLIADEFLTNLKGKIDDLKSGKNVEYSKGIELRGGIANENFEYYLKDKNGNLKLVDKTDFIKAGFDTRFEPKASNQKGGFSLDIKKNKIIGSFD